MKIIIYNNYKFSKSVIKNTDNNYEGTVVINRHYVVQLELIYYHRWKNIIITIFSIEKGKEQISEKKGKKFKFLFTKIDSYLSVFL